MLPETLVNEVIKQICKSLASFDVKTRNKGFKRLQKVISFCNTGIYHLEVEHCLLLWKGLHYWLWSQDKLINQERLVSDICNLFPAIKVQKTKFDFFAAFLETEVREWRTLDKWRTDKFMMLVRKVFRQILTDISGNDWTDVDQLIELLKVYLISAEACDPAFSLRLHFATIYLEELFKFELDSDQWMKFLTPYFDLIPHLVRNNPMLKRVEDFFYLVLPATDDEDETPLNINFAELGHFLYRLGGAGGKNLKKLYEWATICFHIAGVPPPSEPLPEASPPAPQEKEKRKRKLKTAAKPEEPSQRASQLASPPRKRRKIETPKAEGKRTWISPSPAPETKRLKPSLSSMSEKKLRNSSPSPVNAEKKLRTSAPSPVKAEKKTKTTSPSPVKVEKTKPSPIKTAAAKKKSPADTKKAKGLSPSPKTPAVTPHVKGKSKRVSFGKIYRKPFKKKDAVKTPSPGTITTSSAGKGILKKSLLRQSKKLGLLLR